MAPAFLSGGIVLGLYVVRRGVYYIHLITQVLDWTPSGETKERSYLPFHLRTPAQIISDFKILREISTRARAVSQSWHFQHPRAFLQTFELLDKVVQDYNFHSVHYV